MSRRADIQSRIVRGADGSLTLLAPGARAGAIEMSDGKIVTRPSSKPDIGPRNAALTRAEAAGVLGVDIEEAARLLDAHEVPRLAAYDGARTRALAHLLAKGHP